MPSVHINQPMLLWVLTACPELSRLEDPPYTTLLGIARVARKYIMDDVFTWANKQLEKLFPINATELYNSNNFAQWRQGQGAVDIILQSALRPSGLPSLRVLRTCNLRLEQQGDDGPGRNKSP